MDWRKVTVVTCFDKNNIILLKTNTEMPANVPRCTHSDVLRNIREILTVSGNFNPIFNFCATLQMLKFFNQLLPLMVSKN